MGCSFCLIKDMNKQGCCLRCRNGLKIVFISGIIGRRGEWRMSMFFILWIKLNILPLKMMESHKNNKIKRMTSKWMKNFLWLLKRVFSQKKSIRSFFKMLTKSWRRKRRKVKLKKRKSRPLFLISLGQNDRIWDWMSQINNN